MNFLALFSGELKMVPTNLLLLSTWMEVRPAVCPVGAKRDAYLRFSHNLHNSESGSV